MADTIEVKVVRRDGTSERVKIPDPDTDLDGYNRAMAQLPEHSRKAVRMMRRPRNMPGKASD